VNISISFYDNETTEFNVWQDWDEEDDQIPLTPASDNNTWKESAWNDTRWWGILDIEGGALDFTDPVGPTPSALTGITHEIGTNYIPIVMAGTLLFTVIAIALTGDLTIDKLVALLIIAIIAIVTISIIMGV
jgi:type IV secretory pathway VirB6-like protein